MSRSKHDQTNDATKCYQYSDADAGYWFEIFETSREAADAKAARRIPAGSDLPEPKVLGIQVIAV